MSDLPTYSELIESVTAPDGAIDAAKLDQASKRSPRSNGGVRCDVSSGPCSCGAWH